MAGVRNFSLRPSLFLHRPSSFARISSQLQSTGRRGWRTTGAACIGNGRFRQASKREPILHPPIIQRRTTSSSLPRKEDARNQGKSSAEPLPAYRPPTAGLLAHLPASFVPYAELIRLDKPTGTYYLFLPCLFSTLLAAPLTDPITPPSTVLYTSALFFAGALIMRGAGCTVNDLWDRNLDPLVARTRLRPIARGAISVRQAIPFLGVQLLAGLGVLLQFPSQCLYYGIPSLLLVAAYPLAKRVTNYPQIVLGLTFSWGAMMGFPALGIDLLSNAPALWAAVSLYASCVSWTVVYDMIYAYQDIKDDAAAGIKSIALAQEANAKMFLSTIAVVQVALLVQAGVIISASPVYFVLACGGTYASLQYMITQVNLKSVEDCWGWFKRGAWFTGGAISVGLFLEYLASYSRWYEKPRAQDGIENK